MLRSLSRDARSAARRLVQTPGFTLVAVLSLALGIGGTTTIFGFLNALLLRPLPYRDAGSLVDVSETNPIELCAGCGVGTSFPAFLEWRERATSFARLDAYVEMPVTLGGGDALPERTGATLVTAGLLESLGGRPLNGRLFVEDDDRAGAAPVTILSHRLWVRRYGADPGILGRAIRVNGIDRTVVGVMQPRFVFPEQAALWLPLVPEQPARARDDRSLGVLGRLRDGVTMAQAGAEMTTLARQMESAEPSIYRGWTAGVGPYRSELQDPTVNTAFGIALAAAVFVLLVACANLANLQLARGAARARELAIRAAAGARRADVVRQLLGESILLALVGGLAALLVAAWGVKAIVALIGAQIPGWIDLSFDWRVFGFTLVIAVATGLAFGIVPALRAGRTDVLSALKSGGPATGGVREGRLRDGLTLVQVTIAAVLLFGTGIVLKAFAVAQRTDNLGYDPTGVLHAEIDLREGRYADPAAVRAFASQALERLRATAGIDRAAVEYGEFLGTFVGRASRVQLDGRAGPVPNEVGPRFGAAVTPDYFELYRIPIGRGRGLAETDRSGAPLVAVVSQVVADRLWPGEDPIGKRLRIADGGVALSPNRGGPAPAAEWLEVVGVAGNVIGSPLGRTETPMLYTSFAQRPGRPISLHLRTGPEPAALVGSVRRVIAELDPDQPVDNVMTFEQRLATWIAPVRVMLGLMAALGGIGLALAAFGLYAVLAYRVAQRTRELGIRLALGASAPALRRMVLGRGLGITLLALVVAVPLAWALAQMLHSVLFNIRSSDPPVFGVVAGMLAAVALAASYLPARRATRVDPLEAIRAE
jgi:predicted permease